MPQKSCAGLSHLFCCDKIAANKSVNDPHIYLLFQYFWPLVSPLALYISINRYFYLNHDYLCLIN